MAKITICRWEWNGHHYEADHWEDTVREYYKDYNDSVHALHRIPEAEIDVRIKNRKDDWMKHFRNTKAFVEVEVEEG
jgi:hypothetical protein